MITFKNLSLINTFEERRDFGKEAYRIVALKSLEDHNIEVEVSRRCKRAAGNIRLTHFGKHIHINVSYDYYIQFGIERSLGTLRHEFAHLIAYKLIGKMDHGEEFKAICVELGGTMNRKMAGFTYAASASEEYIKVIKPYKYVYSCRGCSNKIERARKISDSTKRKICGYCGTKLIHWTEQYIVL